MTARNFGRLFLVDRMINKTLKNLIEKNALAFATTNKKCNPHCIVVGCPKVVDKNKIVITNVEMVQTIKNIKQNKNVALVVWNRDWEKNCFGYKLKGKAKYFTSGKWKNFVDKMPENKEYKPKGASS